MHAYSCNELYSSMVDLPHSTLFTLLTDKKNLCNSFSARASLVEPKKKASRFKKKETNQYWLVFIAEVELH